MKAKEWINKILSLPYRARIDVDWEAVDEIEGIMEKAIPKEPNIYTDTRNWMSLNGTVNDMYDVDTYECPSCNSYICDCDDSDYQDDYCSKCGQLLDWSE